MNRLSSIHIGLGCCLASATGYTLANAFLRRLSTSADQVVTIFVKESVTPLLLLPVFLVFFLLGRLSWPGWRCVRILVLAGIVTQLGGNLPIIWSFSVVGMSIAMPVYLGMNLVGAAILGRIVLKEPVCIRTICAIGLLVASVILLNLGGSSAPDLEKVDWGRQILGTAAAAFGGFCLSILAVSIRYALLASEISPGSTFWAVVLMIPGAGTYVLGPLILVRSGIEVFHAITPDQISMMIAAGLLNFVAFFMLSKGLQRVPVVLVNITSTTQVAMGALLGIFVFHEAVSVWLVAGLLTAIAGVILIGSKRKR